MIKAVSLQINVILIGYCQRDVTPLHKKSENWCIFFWTSDPTWSPLKLQFRIGQLSMYHTVSSLQWRHNDHDSISNHQPHGCLLNRLFGRRSKKTSKPRVTGLCTGNSPGSVNSPHKGPVMRKMFPFDDVVMPDICIYYIELAIWNIKPWYNILTKHLSLHRYMLKYGFYPILKASTAIKRCHDHTSYLGDLIVMALQWELL